MIENNWSIVVIALCSLLLVVLFWVEIKRSNRAWLMLRLVATTVSVVSLAFMVIPLYVTQSTVTKNGDPVILLTHGFNKDSVSSFKKLYPDSPLYFYNADHEKNTFSAAIEIDQLSQLQKVADYQIHVFGEGLEPEDADFFSSLNIVFHPTVLYPGLQAISWSRQVVSGDRLIVQGTYLNATSSPAKLLLAGFNTSLDSTIILPNSTKTFQLSTLPKNTGKAIYSFTAFKNKDTVVNEPLPTEVTIPKPISVLLLASSPDFENKFLKNWLAGHGYKVALRTYISRNKYSSEFVNLMSMPLSSLQASLIGQFDVVIADAKELKQISRADLTALQSSIDQKGVGLVVRADSSLPVGAFYNRNFGLASFQFGATNSLLIHGTDTSFRFKALKADGLLYGRSITGNQAVFYDQQNHSLVSQAIYGAGKILIQPVSNTYQWVLSDSNNDYENFWSTLLSIAAKKEPVKEHWFANEVLPTVDKPVNIQLLHSNDSMPIAQIGLEKVNLQQNAMLPYKWNGRYWPLNAGWQTFIASTGQAEYWYVFDKNDYRNLRSIQKTNFTLQHTNQTLPASTDAIANTRKEPISIAWFFFLFVLSAGFLWIEKKFL